MRRLFLLLMILSQPAASFPLHEGECVKKLGFPFATYRVVEVVDQDYYVVREILDGREYSREFALFVEEVTRKRFKKVSCSEVNMHE